MLKEGARGGRHGLRIEEITVLLLRLSSSVAMSPLRGVWGGRRGRAASGQCWGVWGGQRGRAASGQCRGVRGGKRGRAASGQCRGVRGGRRCRAASGLCRGVLGAGGTAGPRRPLPPDTAARPGAARGQRSPPCRPKSPPRSPSTAPPTRVEARFYATPPRWPRARASPCACSTCAKGASPSRDSGRRWVGFVNRGVRARAAAAHRRDGGCRLSAPGHC